MADLPPWPASGFGLARVKEEGAPIHPDDLDWEHPPGSGCVACQAKYDKQLQAWQAWEAQKAKA